MLTKHELFAIIDITRCPYGVKNYSSTPVIYHINLFHSESRKAALVHHGQKPDAHRYPSLVRAIQNIFDVIVGESLTSKITHELLRIGFVAG